MSNIRKRLPTSEERYTKAVDDAEIKWCKHCHDNQFTISFYVRLHGRPVLTDRCQRCRSRTRTNYHVLAGEELRNVKAISRRKTAFGIDQTRYEALLLMQCGQCAICGSIPDYNLCVDHDHETGQIRGLLCRPCNLVLGNAKDDTIILTNAIDYIGWRNN